ncbi:hypothetical protein KQI42_08470 [Tissierella sp. MSJ-40]|uniref:Uncharacterized protein n=1 Tax=Tissierella simiarum TaxID=2841534 RepID=A0ABS6E734_9FIRM|nr:hypothetical protein [Tissierella simiarum]MBU5438038.1 hypothetical protein [Tissierella simiarum]
MKIDIEIQPESSETRVVIYTPEITNEVQEIINSLKRKKRNESWALKMRDFIY